MSGLVLQNLWPDFPINGQVTFFLAMVASIGSYVGVSLLTCRAPFDLDRMLHRADGPPRLPNRNWLALLLGVDREFKRGDRLISGSVFVWNGVMFAAFLIITTSNLWRIWPDRWWWNYNLVNLGLTAVIASVTVVWFACGGLCDLFRLFRLLARTKNNPLDDGTVVAHQNAAELPEPEQASAALSEARQ